MNIYTTIQCKYCSRKAKNLISNSQHEIRCQINPNRIISHIEQYGKSIHHSGAWNKGLTKDDPRVAKGIESRKNGDYVPHCTPHKQETKDKLSKIRIDYLKNNPDKVPYLLNHYTKGLSYPEQYWKEILDNNNIIYTEQYRIGLYSLDFAIESLKIDLEIDGEQHYVDNRIVQSDIKRTKFLEDSGWSTIRIRWATYKKLSKEQRILYVNSIVKLLS